MDSILLKPVLMWAVYNTWLLWRGEAAFVRLAGDFFGWKSFWCRCHRVVRTSDSKAAHRNFSIVGTLINQLVEICMASIMGTFIGVSGFKPPNESVPVIKV